MKKLFLVSFSMLLFTPLLFSQGKHKESTGTIKSLSKEDLAALPFTKGKWEYDITKPDLNFSHLNIKTNDVKQGSQSQFNLDLGANYYFANHLALGLSVIDNMSDFKSTGNSKQTDNSLMGYLNFTYGTALSTNVGFYARAGVGIGSMKDKYTPPTGPGSTDKSDLFGYKINAGLPISVEANGPVYFTPEVGYHSRRDKFDLGTETDEGFDFALKFETFLFCREMECDAHNGYNFSHSAYDQGRSYLGVETRGLLSFGDVKTKYTNNFPDQKENYTSVDLAANYMY
ncbi:MAG: hypothetical protein ABJA78_15485, partial [Ferruginibacter sp.]